MRLCLLLLAVLPVALARINVRVSGNDVDELDIQLIGEEIQVISEKEINTFGLTTDNVKNGVSKAFGKWPTDVYLKSSTPWGDLYSSYNWDQSQVTLKPISAKVLGISSNVVIVKTVLFENTYKVDTAFNADISDEVSTTFSSSWDKSFDLSVGHEIGAELNLGIGKVSGKTSFSFSHSWGESESKSKTEQIGSSSGLQVTLKPGQKAIAELQATRGTLKIQVEYDATVNGDVATNYDEPFNGHHFWAHNLGSVMKAAGLEQTKRATEVIEVGFYVNERVVIRDGILQTVLLNKPLLQIKH